MRSLSNFVDHTARPLVLTACLLLACFSNVNSQLPKPRGKCIAEASQVYFVENGQMVTDVSPSGTTGYQLNIIGNNADKLELVPDNYISTFYVIPGYTSASQAKWQLSFAQNNERILCHIKLKNTCTGEILFYPLTVGVKLLNR